jgi:superfamily II DNA or RNA helicase
LWTYIRKSNLDTYLQEHSKLTDMFNQICLLETQDACFLPRLMVVNYPSKSLVQYNGKKIVEAEPVQFKFKGSLRANQIPIVDTVLKNYQKHGIVNGIIKARPGIGKTVMSVYIAAKLGLKTCVVVDNSNLMDQWIKAIYDFTDLTENDIGIIKQKLTVTNKPVTVAMCQSLLSKLKGNIRAAFEFVDESRFGLVFYDEVHSTSASENYAKASLLFRTKNIIGLSATPFQTGAQEVLMKNTIGELIYETNEYEVKPRYFLVYYDSGLGSKETAPGGKDYSKMLMRSGDFIRRKAMYNKIIIQSEKYLQLISTYTKNLVSKDHTVIIICFTKKQVQTISERLTNIGVNHRRYYGEEREIDKDTDQVLVVTYSFCGKGFDFKRLSALIYATPLAGKKSIIQTTGRILRDYEGKRQPIVVDLVDMAFPFISLKDVKIKVPVIQKEFQIPVEEHRDL